MGVEEFFQIHEVHYEDGVPKLVTQEGARVGGDSLEEIEHTLSLMRDALKAPVLEQSYFDGLKDSFSVDDLSEEDKVELKAELEELKKHVVEAPTNLKEFLKWLNDEPTAGC
jgi:hypothetical protein